ncbi:MAG: hypothetical protein K1X28_00345 [Parachlamydiales bacterium]|nr:hypothetical protein [Parachlamydiales bacterium]
MKRFLLIVFTVLSLSWTAYVRTDGFSTNIIEGPLNGNAGPLTEETKSILAQPFHYLGKGRQCFVFESGDGHYVIKFFNQRYLRMPWYSWLTGSKEKAKREKRRFFYEHSYEIAFREFGEEILVLHMGQAQEMPTLEIRDKASRKHHIDLNRIPFVLQRKGIPFYEGLQAVFQKEGMEGLCREIDVFVKQVENRISKKIADADVDVEHNWGYVDGKLFHLDPGRLYCEPSLENPVRRKKEWHNATYRLNKWLKVHHPEAAKYLTNQLPAS